MRQKEYVFDEATPLQGFIDQYRDKIVGHTLKACYTSMPLFVKMTSEYPVFFVFDNICFGIEYLYRGHIKLLTADESDFSIRETKWGPKFMFHSKTEGWEDVWLCENADMPAINKKATEISIWKFSERYEDYPNSERPDGGDYFSTLTLTLEDGTEMNLCAEPAINDGYIDLWLTHLPAYTVIKAELDRTPSDLGMRTFHEFDDVIWGCDPTPDELADLAMYYMRKCDHEIEKYREKNGTSMSGYHTQYSDHLHHVIKLFVERDMNKDYVDSTGKALRDLALEIGAEAGNRVLPLIYTDQKEIGSLDWIVRNLELGIRILRDDREKLKAIYDSLPEPVRETEYGQKLNEIVHGGLSRMELQVTSIVSDLNRIH